MSLSSKVEIVEFAPRVEMRMKARVKRYEENTIWATPALPNDVFEGGLRKRELYSTTAPVAIRKVSDVVREGKYRGGIYEWAIVVPGTHVGSGSVLIPRHEATRTEIVNVGKRVMAVRRFGGYAKEDEVKKWIAVVREVVEEKGWGMGLTWVRSYDAKVGFNERGLLSMAMYGSSDGVPRVNEIAAEIDGWEMS